MNRRDIAIGVIVLILLAGFAYYRQRNQKPVETVPQVQSSTEQSLEDKMKIEIPEDVDKTELKDQSGGTATAIATRDFENGKFTSSVIADLPPAETGGFYQAWLVKGTPGASDYSLTSLGNLRTAKGGYIVDFSGVKDLSDHGKVQVTLEKKADNTPEKVVLEGNF